MSNTAGVREESVRVLGIPIQTLMAFIPMLVAGVGGYFVLKTTVDQIAATMAVLSQDHDTIVRMEATIQSLSQDMSENREYVVREIAKVAASNELVNQSTQAKLAKHDAEIMDIKTNQETRFLRLEFSIDEMIKRVDRALVRNGQTPEGPR